MTTNDIQNSSEGLLALQNNGTVETLAMVYKNEYSEVSYISSDAPSVSVVVMPQEPVSIIFALVFTLVALVTISRRKID